VTEWPVDIDGVVESLVATLGPNDRWNVAALGLHGPGDEEGEDTSDSPNAVTARTWGRTRTRRNFESRGGGYVQFTRDPVDFAEAALGIREESSPVLDSADAWAEVEVTRLATGEDGGTEWAEWRLNPRESAVECETVPVTNRGYYAVVEATVAASRLNVDAYDTETLRERLSYFESVTERCGGEREKAAFERIHELTEWE
jgi:hypothetical protein